MEEAQKIEAWAREFGCHIKKYGDAPRAIIIGESHRDEEQMSRQKNLIARLRPEFVLHEYGARCVIYDPEKNEKILPTRRSLSKLDAESKDEEGHECFDWAREIGFVLVGGDFTHGELKTNNIADTYGRGASRLKERIIARLIDEYAKKSEKIVPAIVGGHYIREDSTIHSLLQNKGIEYWCEAVDIQIFKPSSPSSLSAPANT